MAGKPYRLIHSPGEALYELSDTFIQGVRIVKDAEATTYYLPMKSGSLKKQ